VQFVSRYGEDADSEGVLGLNDVEVAKLHPTFQCVGPKLKLLSRWSEVGVLTRGWSRRNLPSSQTEILIRTFFAQSEMG
jgi:hypothetical protein